MIDYKGIDEATLIHALYHGTTPLGMGVFQNHPSLTIEEVRNDLREAHTKGLELRFDYYYGRPLKLRLDEKAKTFDGRLYDRDAGPGKAERIVKRLRAETT